MKNQYSKVYRKKVLEGFCIPGIIKNGTYFFSDFEIYEDGRVNCWNFEDYEHFIKDVHRGWVATSIPNKEEISIYGLGSLKIDNSNWKYNGEAFIEYVDSLIKKLNPNLENIYKYSEKKVNGIRIGESANGNIYKEYKRRPNDPFPEKIDGEKTNIFWQNEFGDFYLVRLDIYDNNSIIVNRLKEPFEINLNKLEEMISNGNILTEVPLNSKVQIYGLGHFQIIELLYCNDVSQKLLEIKDTLRVLNGEPSSLDICRKEYEEYLQNPSNELKEQLKTAYENIPEHERRFVGDMDMKDIPIRMIIYGEKEIENWSHYQVAKNLGEKLPSIKIPKSKD